MVSDHPVHVRLGHAAAGLASQPQMDPTEALLAGKMVVGQVAGGIYFSF